MLTESLSEYTSQDFCPMHMPGHKRNIGLLGTELPYSIDITEIDGFDDLHNPHGILKKVSEAAAALYGSKASFLLVNGSTGGILAAVRAVVKPGDTVVMARNCHRSVYHACELCGAKTVYLLPEQDADTGLDGGISPAGVDAALAAHPDTSLVIVTSPTYVGVTSDIRSIAAIAHRRGIPLLVDQAHGAHFGFSPGFPEDALRSGADLVVVSLHKTLPALTQCALAHVGGDIVNPERLSRELSVFETSSPSYVLLASMDRCIEILLAQRETLFFDFEKNLRSFDRKIAELKNLTVVCHGADQLSLHKTFHGFDDGKIVVCTRKTDLSGVTLMECLRKQYHIEFEMASAAYAVGIASICDPPAHFDLLADALTEIDKNTHGAIPAGSAGNSSSLPAQVESIGKALFEDGCLVALRKTDGLISLDYVWAYPPGVPLIVPGEIVDSEIRRQMDRLLASGVTLHSTSGKMPDFLRVRPQGNLTH